MANDSIDKEFVLFGKGENNVSLSHRKSANWLNRGNQPQERASGAGAALIKRKLYQPVLRNDSDDDTGFSTPARKKQKVMKRDTSKPIINTCEWIKCSYATEALPEYMTHVNNHVKDHRTAKLYKCKWGKCTFGTKLRDVLHYHVDYHGYLTNLKGLGTNFVESNELPSCHTSDIDPIPIRDQPYRCDWIDCDTKFNQIHNYIYHVLGHSQGEPTVRKEGNKSLLCCLWSGCLSKSSDKWGLKKHLRRHTTEKLIACPTCSQTFTTVTKFCDHRIRQDAPSEQFQCSQCFKYYPSERLLRQHVKDHINVLKCHLCDMTCLNASMLSKHIRYRHLPYRPFKCELCEFGCVTKSDLSVHMLTHYPEKIFQCIDCPFKCRSSNALETHYGRVHGAESQRVYMCHCCNDKFPKGALLTKHLMRKHDFQWPSGHSRFRYTQDPDDGMFRLQTMRLESIEVTQEIINKEKKQAENIGKENMENENDDRTYLLKSEIVSTDNNVLITICEVDQKGNMVKTETMESNELRLASEK